MSDPSLIEAVKQAMCADLDRQEQSGPEFLYIDLSNDPATIDGRADLHALAIAAVKAMTDFARRPQKGPTDE